MHLFVRVAERGNFSAIAQEMGVARSVVTRQIAALETHLQVKLLARSTRRLSLTSAGAAYLEKCRVILNLVESAESDIAGEQPMLRGSIRLSVPLSFGVRHLAPLLLEFAALYPEVSLHADYSEQRSNLFEEGIDLAVRIASRLDPGDVARRIGTSRMCVVASPDYLARHGTPEHPADLIHHECLGYTGTANPLLWEFLIEGRPKSFPIRSRLLASNGDVLVQAATAGFGITCAPAFVCADALRDGAVSEILTSHAIAPLGIHVLLPGNRFVPQRVRALMNFLAERIDRDPSWNI